MQKYTLILALMGLLFYIAGCSEKAAELEQDITKITNVEYFTVKETTFEEYIDLPVVVFPNKEVNLGLTGGGKVTNIYVDKGNRVKEGMILLETDDVLLKAQYDIANASLEFQKTEFERNEKLFRERSITAAAFDGSKFQLSEAQSTYDMAKKRYEDATLKAPFSGIVTSRTVEVGDILAPGSPAFRIIDMSRVRIQAGIPEKYIGDFKVGNDVNITLDAVQEVNFKGIINFISPEANSQVRTFLAEMVVDNSKDLIRAGIMGNAKILRNVHENALMIPINALIETQNGRIVYVLKEGNVVEERKIEIQERTDVMIQVKGLNSGEKIISKGQYDLIDGERVNVTGEYSSGREEAGS